MGFTDEEVRAWVLDGGTRFVAPGQNKYDEDSDYSDDEEVSDERLELTDEDVLRVLSALGDAVDLDLAGCKRLTDAIVKEIVRRCPNLKNLDVECVGRARARARARQPDAVLGRVARGAPAVARVGRRAARAALASPTRGQLARRGARFPAASAPQTARRRAAGLRSQAASSCGRTGRRYCATC